MYVPLPFRSAISHTCRLKSIKIKVKIEIRSKPVITGNWVIDFYRLPIFVDWSVSILIDNDQFLLTIKIIDLLHPGYMYFDPCGPSFYDI